MNDSDAKLTPDSVAGLADEAATRIDGHIRTTPLDFSPVFSERTGCNVYFKLENLQHTGSFKLRGALNRVMTLADDDRAAGVVAASSGNHGAAVAYALKTLGVDGIIFVPEKTASTKVDAIKSYGGDVRFFGTDGLDTELHARAHARRHGMRYLSPYNDPQVIAGQGSCGVEIARQLPEVDAVLVAVGGGGLISGVGSVLRRHGGVQVIGCQPANSPVMTRSVEAGRILEMASEPTLSDGTAGGVEKLAITFDLCRDLIDRYVLVGEEEIASGMRAFMDAEHQLIEGAAGVAVAALDRVAGEFAGKNVVVVVCGANVSRATLRQVIRE